MVGCVARASCEVFRATMKTFIALKHGWQIVNIWHESSSLFPSKCRFQILNIAL